ncbi:MAG: fumarylacetoacetate hydrolase family protein [Chloroflexota bacterium]
MRLVSFRRDGVEELGVVRPDGRYLPASALGGALPATMLELLRRGPVGIAALRAAAVAAPPSVETVDPASVELLAPVPRPGKVIAVGLNYNDHAAEGGRAAPAQPMLFAKFPTSVIGPGATVEWDPALTAKVDLEAELGVVIGQTARRVAEADALDVVAGYTIVNDVSARDLQAADKQFVRAKSLDTFCPMGPVLVTADEIPDPQRLAIRGSRNGVVMQDANTRQMIFSVANLIAFCSRAFTLEPGDVIATGTPSGVGIYREPPVLMGEGDVMTIEIEGIGALTNPCRFWQG